mmetsp:Transcript_22445/g.57691  ORF Transcript_22445/g.57691 Transcript_22445/m.57691 type:complete len:366 (+) Transcript_22445:1539-2636(+)
MDGPPDQRARHRDQQARDAAERTAAPCPLIWHAHRIRQREDQLKNKADHAREQPREHATEPSDAPRVRAVWNDRAPPRGVRAPGQLPACAHCAPQRSAAQHRHHLRAHLDAHATHAVAEPEAGEPAFGLVEQEAHVAQHALPREEALKVAHRRLDAVLRAHALAELPRGLAHLLVRAEHTQAFCKALRAQHVDRARLGPDARSAYHLAPKVLVTEEGADQGRLAVPQPSGCRAGTAVVDHSRHSGEQLVVRPRTDVVAQAVAAFGCAQLGPRRLHEHACAREHRGAHDRLSELVLLPNRHRAKADEDRLWPLLQPRVEPAQLGLVERGGLPVAGPGRLRRVHRAHDLDVLAPLLGLEHQSLRPHA